MTAASSDISKIDLLRELGFGGEPALYDAALQSAGLSNPRKPRIAVSKREAVAAVLADTFMRVCSRGDCSNRARAEGGSGGRTPVPAASQADCEICGGSVNRGSTQAMLAAFAACGWTRLCVVGGSPSTREDLGRLLGDHLGLRLIDGTRARNQAEADADCAWADLVVLWGSTELAHKVSERYRGRNVITAPRRGVADLAREAATAASRASLRSTGR